MVITAAASGAAQEQALQMAARQGRISFFGGLPKDNPIIACDSNLVHYRELTIVGANGSSPAHNARGPASSSPRAPCPVADLITHRLPLAARLDAFDIVARGEAIKVTIEPCRRSPMPSPHSGRRLGQRPARPPRRAVRRRPRRSRGCR